MTMSGHVYLCKDVDFASFYGFYWILNCSDSVVFLVFNFIHYLHQLKFYEPHTINNYVTN